MAITVHLQKIYEKLERIEEKFIRILSFEEKLEKILNITEFLRGYRPCKDGTEDTCQKKRQNFKTNGKLDENQQTFEKKKRYMPDFHVKVLQKNHKVLVNELCIRGHVIDDLIENEAIYQSDQEAIMSCSSQKDQIRSLLMCLSHYGEDNFLKFVTALDSERPDLAKNLQSDYQRQKSEHPEENLICLRCCIYNQVDIKDAVDDLYTDGLVDESFLQRAVGTPCRHERKHLWNEVFSKMQYASVEDRNKYYESLQNVIQRKYRSLFSDFSDFVINELTVKCICKEKQNGERISFDQDSSREAATSSIDVQASGGIEQTQLSKSQPTNAVTEVRRRPKLRKRRNGNVRAKSKTANLLIANVLHHWYKTFQSRQNKDQSSTESSFGLSEDARYQCFVRGHDRDFHKAYFCKCRTDSCFASSEMNSTDFSQDSKDDK
ncbi:uncharacterized protein LOC133199449 [Saccostrea echinata]|uniref:uncharacterized protein LOC133199397 n=1 Tax=Saccostrea echinata TaxID=191078 RepID=UPI002A80BBC5|nr:uncharacterized protein LOC133199397 [Saccostrea echinata]XP_061191235.1 uncharacterized protein LOC133199449 [Saccostrea echinata]